MIDKATWFGGHTDVTILGADVPMNVYFRQWDVVGDGIYGLTLPPAGTRGLLDGHHFAVINTGPSDVLVKSSAGVTLWTLATGVALLCYYAAAGDTWRGVTQPMASDGGVDAYAATGGTITVIPGYIVHTFTVDGTFTPAQPLDVEYLLVGGGGAGGLAGGGGAGGWLAGTFPALPQAYAVAIGAGGVGDNDSPYLWAPGGNTTVFGLVAQGGGGGGTTGAGNDSDGQDGGCGGGAAINGDVGDGAQGGDGGSWSLDGGDAAGGGGGGANAAGGDGLASPFATAGGVGGAGKESDINGTPTHYAGGGGGYSTDNPGAGGVGGGGDGEGVGAGSPGTDGEDGKGGGGGAGTNAGGDTCSGGKGIVILRYAIQAR